jgi:hypothetical protein
MSRCATYRDSRAGLEAGAALVAVVGIMGLLAVAAGALLLLTSVEVVSSSHHRDALEVAFAAEAGLALGVRELQDLPLWTDALAGTSLAGFRDATVTPVLADGSVADLASLTVAVQAESDALAAFGADNPQWRLFAYGPAGSLVPASSSIAYLVIWIADDGADGDGNPWADANDILQLRADSLGPRFARRGVAASVRRADAAPAGLHVLTWRRVR